MWLQYINYPFCRELVVSRNEQYRVIEEYQNQLLKLEKWRGLPRYKESAKLFLLAREAELVAARAQSQVLTEELNFFADKLKPPSSINSSFLDPSVVKDMNAPNELSSMTKDKALHVLLSEMRRLQMQASVSKMHTNLLTQQVQYFTT
jgi:hypothetical protein